MFLPSPQIQTLDQHFDPADNLQSFATTNALLRLMDQIDFPILHFWMLDRTMILGLKDQRLPHLDDSLQLLKDQNYHYFVRNSGGLGVISDAGILNVSIFIPHQLQEFSVDDAYQKMTDLTRAALPELKIATGEITHSYCPGTFDLSVNGQKIGGMAQRRNPNGTVIMAYFSVTGDQAARGQLVRNIYERGLAGEENKWDFPDVLPESMIDIDELIDAQVTINDLKQRFENACQSFGLDVQKNKLAEIMQQPEYLTYLDFETKQITKRQSKLRK